MPYPREYVLLGPNEAAPLIMNREKALLEVSLSLGPEGEKVNALCKIDSGAETNILPKSPVLPDESGEAGFSITRNHAICIWWNRDSKHWILLNICKRP